MIGYYIHHHGRGHLNRARAIAARSTEPITGLSSLERPADWIGDWVRLQRDDAGTGHKEPTAGGRLHWVPLRDDGLRGRMAAISAWIERSRPALVVSDVSVEVAVLARLHGVPVVSVALPGHRADAAHSLGYAVSTALLAAWPASAADMLTGIDETARAKLHPVGAISRFVPPPVPTKTPTPRSAVVLQGGGDTDGWGFPLGEAMATAAEWDWTVLGGDSWSDDPWPALCSAGVVVTHAGQNAVAEVAAAGRPAVVIPQRRPFAEQEATASALRAGPWPVVVLDRDAPAERLRGALAAASALDGTAWRGWADGSGASAAAHLLERLAASSVGER